MKSQIVHTMTLSVYLSLYTFDLIAPDMLYTLIKNK